MNTKYSVFAILALLALACNPKPASAPRSIVAASSDDAFERVVRNFDRQSLRFGTGGAKFFLWKLKTVAECPSRATIPVPGSQNPGGPQRPERGACPADISFVLDTSKTVNKSDDLNFSLQSEQDTIKANVLAKEIKNTAGTVLTVEALIQLLDTNIPEAVANRERFMGLQNTAKTQKTAKEAELAAEVAKPETEQNADTIMRLQGEISSLATKIRNYQAQIDRFITQITDATNAPVQVNDAGLTAQIQQFRSLKTRRAEIDTTCTRLTQELDATVDLYGFSDNLTVEFRFPDAKDRRGLESAIAVDIQGWDFRTAGSPETEAGDHSFSTSDGTITDVTYTERGGTFEFNVQAQDGRYHFKVSRSRYRSTDKRVHMQGDIIRYGKNDPVGAQPRRGVAVLDEKS